MTALLAKLSEQQVLLEHQKNALALAETSSPKPDKDDSSSEAVPLTPATEGLDDTSVIDGSENGKMAHIEADEMERLKKELDVAKDRIARQEQELSQTRVIKHAFDHVKTGTNTASTIKPDNVDQTITNLQEAFTASRSIFTPGTHEDARSDASETLSTGAMHSRGGNIWTNPSGSNYNGLPNPPNIWCQNSNRSWVNRPGPSSLPSLIIPQHQIRNYSGPSSPISVGHSRYFSDFNQYPSGNGGRRSNIQNGRNGPIFGQGCSSGWDSYGPNGEVSPMMGISTASHQQMGMFQAPIGYQPRPIGTPLSPTAAEFTAGGPVGPWNSTVSDAKLYDVGSRLMYLGSLLHRARHMFPQWSHSIIVVCLIVVSLVTGNILSIR